MIVVGAGIGGEDGPWLEVRVGSVGSLWLELGTQPVSMKHWWMGGLRSKEGGSEQGLQS